ncbi:unnamed protein product [Paramecium sonneborni]|uniref:Uncharacterized protein n=1 Tax=Paramecium sonneborni TaxID=65129 RepID=A0A8S1PG51_9CILI|nr:unnamed protein product [Paramecium sonneborni]
MNRKKMKQLEEVEYGTDQKKQNFELILNEIKPKKFFEESIRIEGYSKRKQNLQNFQQRPIHQMEYVKKEIKEKIFRIQQQGYVIIIQKQLKFVPYQIGRLDSKYENFQSFVRRRLQKYKTTHSKILLQIHMFLNQKALI